jgi:hypothetical protein
MRRPAARARQVATSPTPRGGRPSKLPAVKPPPELTPRLFKDFDLPGDKTKAKMVDEYGELDRRMQLWAPEVARYDTLKRAIKSWFDHVPADADGIVEGAVYRLHLSPRERERRVRSMRDLIAVIGLEKFLELASVPIGAIEDNLGKTRAAALITEARTGSRRIKAVPKQSAGK